VLLYDLRNSSVFNARLKVCIDGNDVIAGGSMFQTLVDKLTNLAIINSVKIYSTQYSSVPGIQHSGRQLDSYTMSP